MVLPQPLSLAPQPTVDRTLASLQLRAVIMLFMVGAEIYAAVIRSVLWVQGHLDSLQQDLAIKNFLFIGKTL
jgi:hypothetical protein